jgi:hypothetical protein
MKDQFFKNKIERLADENLIDLLNKAYKDSANAKIFELAKQEAEKRNIKFDPKEESESAENKSNRFDGDIENLSRWNWGAFILAPFWSLSNKLDKWAILSLLPPINIIVAFYLGHHGNRLAFEKSEIKSVNDFMQIQQGWTKWGIRMFWILMIFGLIGILLY